MVHKLSRKEGIPNNLMEERFLNDLEQCFPKMKFTLIKEKLAGPIFGCNERQTLKAGRKKLPISWTPPISEIKDEEYYELLLGKCIDQVQKLYPKRGWF